MESWDLPILLIRLILPNPRSDNILVKNCDLSKNTYFWAGTGLISLSNHSLYQAVIIHQNKFSPDAIGTIFRHLRRFFERSIFYFLCTIFYN